MSKKKKRLALYLAPVIGVFVIVVVGGVVVAKRVKASAQRFAQTGTAAIALLNQYGSGVAALDMASVLSSYDEAYMNENEGFWVQNLETERDGVRTYAWKLEARRTFRKSDQAEQLSRYFATLRSIDESHVKLARLEDVSDPDNPVIHSVLWVVGTNASGEAFESQAHFRMWLRHTAEGFVIRKQELLHGKTVIGDRNGFADVTDEVGLDFVAKLNPDWDTPAWYPKTFGIIKYGTGGVSAVDFDQDGWYDIYFADGLHSRLYRNNRDGTFRDVTAAVGLPTEMSGVNVALFADFDNDGDKDLFLGRATDLHRMYRNDGGRYTDVSEQAGLGGYLVTVAATADYDNDGKLDLYLGRYLDPRTELPTTLFYTRNSVGNILLRNEGNFRFTDVTTEAGVREGGLTLGVAWGDYDNDGDQDLYVANDFGRNALLRNNGNGSFSDVSIETGTLDFGFGMSTTFGDIDNDGDLDIYISNVHSGQRWFGQATTLHQYLLTSIWQGTIFEDFRSYKDILTLAGTDWQAYGDMMISGNSLLLNDGKGSFTDVSEASGTNPFGWYWGSVMFDYDNDGRQDIYAGNGWITAKSKDDL